MNYGITITLNPIGATPFYTGGPFVSGVAKLSSAPETGFDAGRLTALDEVDKVANIHQGGALTSISKTSASLALSKSEWEDLLAAGVVLDGSVAKVGRLNAGTMDVFCTLRVVDKEWAGGVLTMKFESMVSQLADAQIPSRKYDQSKHPKMRESDIGFAGPAVYGHADEVRAIGITWDDEAALVPLVRTARGLAMESFAPELSQYTDWNDLITDSNHAVVCAEEDFDDLAANEIVVRIALLPLAMFALAAFAPRTKIFRLLNSTATLPGVFIVTSGAAKGMAFSCLSRRVVNRLKTSKLHEWRLIMLVDADVRSKIEVGDTVGYIASSATLVVSENAYSKVRRLPYVERDKEFKDLGGWLVAADGTLTRAIGSSNTGLDSTRRWRRVRVRHAEWQIDGEEVDAVFPPGFNAFDLHQWTDVNAPLYGFPNIYVKRKHGATSRYLRQTFRFRLHVDKADIPAGSATVRGFIATHGDRMVPDVTAHHVNWKNSIAMPDGTLLGEFNQQVDYPAYFSTLFDAGGPADVFDSALRILPADNVFTKSFSVDDLSEVGYIDFEVEFDVYVYSTTSGVTDPSQFIGIDDMCLAVAIDGEDSGSGLPGTVGRSVVYADIDGTTANPALAADEHIAASGLLLDPPRVAADILHRYGNVTGQISGTAFTGGVKQACTDMMAMAGALTTEGVAASISLVEQTTVAEMVSNLASDFGLVIAEHPSGDYYTFRAALARMGSSTYEFTVTTTEVLESPAASQHSSSVQDLINEPSFKYDLTYASGFRGLSRVSHVDAPYASVTPANVVDYSVGLPPPMDLAAWQVGSLSYTATGKRRPKTLELRTVPTASLKAALGGVRGISRIEYLASTVNILVVAVSEEHAAYNALPGDRVRVATREHTDDVYVLSTVMGVKFLPETGAIKLALVLDPVSFSETQSGIVDSLGADSPDIVDELNPSQDNATDTLEA